MDEIERLREQVKALQSEIKKVEAGRDDWFKAKCVSDLKAEKMEAERDQYRTMYDNLLNKRVRTIDHAGPPPIGSYL